MASIRAGLIALLSVLVFAAAPAVAQHHPAHAAVSAGNVAGFGENGHWELGAGYRNGFEALPVSTVGVSGVKELSAGGGSTIALLNDGTVRGWGGDTYGQLGNGNRYTATRPVPVKGLTGVVQVSEWAAHSIALKGDGTVWTWGASGWGQEGNGLICIVKGCEDLKYSNTVPVQVKGIAGAVQVAAGGASNYALLSNGTVLGWGINRQGQLGNGDTLEHPFPVVVKGLTNVKRIAPAGFGINSGHILALLNDGTVLGLGANGQGQLGDGTTSNRLTPVAVKGLSNVASLAAGPGQTLALLNDGTVEAWGSNEHGELGVPTTQRCGKALIPCSTIPVAVAGLTSVTQVAANFRFSLAVSGGQAFAWGINDKGQLGNGTRIDSHLPGLVQGVSDVVSVAAGEHHAMVLLAGQGPAPTISLVPGSGSLAVAWRSTDTSERWSVSWRPITKPASKWATFVKLAATARSYTASGLTAGTPYEVLVQNKLFGSRVVEGVPLP